MKIQIVTAKTGATATDRKVLDTITTTTSAPSLSTDGYFLNRVEHIHLLFSLNNPDPSASCTFYIQLWWWNPISEIWHIGERLKVNGNDIHTLEVQGLNRVYMQVDQIVFSGSGTPRLDAWIGIVVPV